MFFNRNHIELNNELIEYKLYSELFLIKVQSLTRIHSILQGKHFSSTRLRGILQHDHTFFRITCKNYLISQKNYSMKLQKKGKNYSNKKKHYELFNEIDKELQTQTNSKYFL